MIVAHQEDTILRVLCKAALAARAVTALEGALIMMSTAATAAVTEVATATRGVTMAVHPVVMVLLREATAVLPVARPEAIMAAPHKEEITAVA